MINVQLKCILIYKIPVSIVPYLALHVLVIVFALDVRQDTYSLREFVEMIVAINY